MKLFFILAFLLVSYVSAEAHTQPRVPNREIQFFYSPGINFQDHVLGEFSIMYGTREYGHGGGAISGVRLGSEFSVLDGKLLLGPKVGYEICVVLFGLRGNVVTYFVSGHPVDVRILPEVGLSLFGAINVFYGMNIPVTTRIEALARHKVTLTLNI